MEPVKINRGQILSMWQVAQTFGVDSEITLLNMHKGDLWIEARSPLGPSATYVFYASGGHAKVDPTETATGDVVSGLASGRDTSGPVF